MPSLNKTDKADVKIPLLIDFDGVINLDSVIAPDAKYFLQTIAEREIPSIILSNLTLYTRVYILNPQCKK